ncbi:MAG: BMP family protein [Candidatus Competibacterales bacterium]
MIKPHIRIWSQALILASAFAGFPVVGHAADYTPALVFDLGGKFDKSFNEAAYRGAEHFRQETGVRYREFEVQNPAQREQGLRRLAQRGADPIVSVGFAQAPAVQTVAPRFADTRFTLIDMVVEAPNVKSVVFKEHEGSFIVGALAAMASSTNTIGFVGGMDIPLIRRFACGYVQGAKHINPDIQVLQNMTGTTPAAWNDRAKGGELARSQFDRGADVVYAAAGATGLGVYQAAADQGLLAIGVDSNQNHLHPGTMLTSMVKRVDVAVRKSFQAGLDGTWTPGVEILGLAEDGVSWALDEHNRDLITPTMEEGASTLEQQIVDGVIEVHDYMSDNRCPV